MAPIDSLIVVIVALCTVLVALGLAASALKLLFAGLLDRQWRAVP